MLKIWTRELGCEFRVFASLPNRLRNCESASSSPDSNPSLYPNLNLLLSYLRPRKYLSLMSARWRLSSNIPFSNLPPLQNSNANLSVRREKDMFSMSVEKILERFRLTLLKKRFRAYTPSTGIVLWASYGQALPTST